MHIRQEIRHAKTLFAHGSNLIMLRLRLLQLDAADQISSSIRIAALIAAAAVCALVGLTALLFALNAVLPASAKGWVFFGIVLLGACMVAAAAWQIPQIWQHSTQQISQTLADLQQDIAQLSGSLKNGKPHDES